MSISGKPAESEYGGSFGRYVRLVHDVDIVPVLAHQLDSTIALLSPLAEIRGDHRYAPGKWTLKELIGHVIDSERVFAYRALRFARNDPTPLPGFDQDTFAANANFAGLALKEIIEEYRLVRSSTIYLLKNLASADWQRHGVADNTELSVRALAFTIAGHELHHLEIVKNRYLQIV